MKTEELTKRIDEIKRDAKSRLLLSFTLILAAFMALGTLEVSQAANQQTTNLQQVVGSGDLSIDNWPTQANFTQGQPSDTTTAQLLDIVSNDDSGEFDGWELAGQLTASWVEQSDATKQIPENQLKWFPGTATITEIQGNSDHVSPGTNGTTLETDQIYMENNTNGPAPGAYLYNRGTMNLDIPVDTATGTYVATLQLTIYDGQNNL